MKIDINLGDEELNAFVRDNQVDELEEWAKQHEVEMLLMGSYPDYSKLAPGGFYFSGVNVPLKWGVSFPSISKSLSILFKMRFGGVDDE